MKTLALIVVLACAVGCSSSSVTLTGEARSPIAIEEVRVYSEPPAEYADVALLEVTPHGWTRQSRQDKAVAWMKEKAAGLGANGVLLTGVAMSGGGSGAGVGLSSGGGVGLSFGTSSSSETVFGRAIFVTREK